MLLSFEIEKLNTYYNIVLNSVSVLRVRIFILITNFQLNNFQRKSFSFSLNKS